MRPVRVGSACWKVMTALDDAMAESALRLSPELAAHAERCPRCRPEVEDLRGLLHRLRAGATRGDLAPWPAVVIRVIAQDATTAPVPKAGLPSHGIGWRWLLGQFAAVAAIFLVFAGGLTWFGLKVNQAVSGTSPSDAMSQVLLPFQQWIAAMIRNIR